MDDLHRQGPIRRRETAEQAPRRCAWCGAISACDRLWLRPRQCVEAARATAEPGSARGALGCCPTQEAGQTRRVEFQEDADLIQGAGAAADLAQPHDFVPGHQNLIGRPAAEAGAAERGRAGALVASSGAMARAAQPRRPNARVSASPSQA